MLRATWKNLLSRKLRLTLSAMAVVLGVMFVSGAFVLTDTLGRSFDGLFATVYADTDVGVAAKRDADQISTPTLPASLLDKVRAVPGVARVRGSASAEGARVIGSNGKVVTSFGPPRLGDNWQGEDGLVKLRAGRGPRADDEIAVNAGLAKAAGIKIGDRVGVLTRQPKRTFTLVGIYGYSGGRDSLGGAQEVSFTEPVAQELMLGQRGVYSGIDVKAEPGVSQRELRSRVQAALGDGYVVKTARQLTDEASGEFKQALSFFNKILLGFAAVALFVGTFIILNTFSILVAQRTRELALMRAVGASRRQMIGSVIAEALVVGLVASVLGLAAGIGVGALLAWVFGNLGGAALQLAGVGVPASAVIGAFGVGVLVTLVAALLPALRASRVPPVAALQEAATPDRPLTRITVGGALVGAAGATALGLGLADKGGDNNLWLILGGVLVTFIGVALLTPLVARPVVGLVGRLFSWSMPGKLGRLNSARNPRRTAITAAALMVGLALITGVNVVLSSATESLRALADKDVKADLIISGEGMSEMPPTFDPGVLDRAAKLDGVRYVAGGYDDMAMINGVRGYVEAITDLPAMAAMFKLTAAEGVLRPLSADEAVIDQEQARKLGLHPGSTVTMRFGRGEPHVIRVVGVYAKNNVFANWMLADNVVSDFRTPQATLGFIQVTPGTTVASVKHQVEALLRDSPEVNVADRSGFVAQQAAQYDSMLTMIQILLALAILIAVLGIVNTLALSVLERTRELGLLRAVGLLRAQTMRMVTVESVVISLFGALLGLAVGTGLGAAVVRALKKDGFTEFALPWSQMGVYLALAAVVGVLAAILPATRAARVNVLTAIAYE